MHSSWQKRVFCFRGAAAAWFAAPNDGISSILKLKTEEVNKLKQTFDLKAVGETIEADVPLSSVVESGYIDLDELTWSAPGHHPTFE